MPEPAKPHRQRPQAFLPGSFRLAPKSMANEAFARAEIGALLGDAGWKITGGIGVRFKHALPKNLWVDYVLKEPQMNANAAGGCHSGAALHASARIRGPFQGSRGRAHWQRSAGGRQYAGGFD